MQQRITKNDMDHLDIRELQSYKISHNLKYIASHLGAAHFIASIVEINMKLAVRTLRLAHMYK